MKIVDFSTRRPVTVFVFALAAIVFGVVAFRDLAVDLLPDITYPSLTRAHRATKGRRRPRSRA